MMGLFQVIGVYLHAFWDLLSELWLYFLIGFLIAGFVAEFIPARALLRYLGKNTVGTLLRATFAGTVASLCSCGAIPIATTIRKRGASRAAALTFMLAAPWAGFTQLVIFYKFLGLLGTAVVFIGALSVAFLTGMILGRLEDRAWLEGSHNRDGEPDCEPGTLLTEELAIVEQARPKTFPRRMLRAGAEAWEAFRELWKYLAFGLLLAAALTAFVPVNWVMRYLGPEATFNPVLAAVPLAALVELCSEGFSIFAGQLHQMGATLAVVFVVVLVGVTTDFTELTVIGGKFGKRAAIAYLVCATALTVTFGLIIQNIFG